MAQQAVVRQQAPRRSASASGSRGGTSQPALADRAPNTGCRRYPRRSPGAQQAVASSGVMPKGSYHGRRDEDIAGAVVGAQLQAVATAREFHVGQHAFRAAMARSRASSGVAGFDGVALRRPPRTGARIDAVPVAQAARARIDIVHALARDHAAQLQQRNRLSFHPSSARARARSMQAASPAGVVAARNDRYAARDPRQLQLRSMSCRSCGHSAMMRSARAIMSSSMSKRRAGKDRPLSGTLRRTRPSAWKVTASGMPHARAAASRPART